MIDAIKKTLLAGVGAAVITKEKVEAALGDFVKQGKVSTAEARQMAEKIASEGKKEFEAMSQDLSEKLRERFTSTERKMTERMAALEARVAALEQVANVAKSAGATAGSPTPEVTASGTGR